MGRIRLAVVLAISFLLVPLAAEAQQAGKLRRIGVVVPVEPSDDQDVAAFRQALRDLGYVDGQNIAVEYLYAYGKAELYPELAARLVRHGVDLMVVGSPDLTRIAKNASQTIPIVMVGGGDPVAFGFVTSLGRPGGNITGLSTIIGSEVFGKWVELLKEAAPTISRIGFLRDARTPYGSVGLTGVQDATRTLGLKLQVLRVGDPQEIEHLLAAMSKERGGALLVEPSPLFFPGRSRVTELVAKHRLPAMYGFRAFVDAGGFMSYGPNLPDLWRRAAVYVDKILKGAKPGDLPVEQPTKFELVINLKTAKTLGLTIPQSVLVRADQIIE